jgi:hypothetical protein
LVGGGLLVVVWWFVRVDAASFACGVPRTTIYISPFVQLSTTLCAKWRKLYLLGGRRIIRRRRSSSHHGFGTTIPRHGCINLY